MEIQWEEPPEDANFVGHTQTGKYREFAIALRQRPGVWAILPGDQNRTEKGALATAQNIRRGKVKGFTANHYDTAVKGTKIWVKYKENPGPAPATTTASRSKAASRVSASDGSISPDAKVVRAWAVSQGMDVPERGRLPQRYIDAYEQAVARGEVALDDAAPDVSPASSNGTAEAATQG